MPASSTHSRDVNISIRFPSSAELILLVSQSIARVPLYCEKRENKSRVEGEFGSAGTGGEGIASQHTLYFSKRVVGARASVRDWVR